MNFITTLRPDHNEQMNNESEYEKGLYRREFEQIKADAEFLSELLSGTDGEIEFRPVEEGVSWFNNEIAVTYKGLEMEISRNYKGKLQIRCMDIYKYSRVVPHSAIEKYKEDVPSPLNYTFSKLTSKKLISWMDYKYDYFIWVRYTAEQTENGEQKDYKEGLELLERISAETGYNIKKHEDRDRDSNYLRSENSMILTPFGFCQVSYDHNQKRANVDYNTRKMIELLNQMKAHNK